MENNPILEAHKNAVRASMNYLEKYCIFYQTKQQEQQKLLQSNTAQIAIFHHDDNRNKNPQLHSHCAHRVTSPLKPWFKRSFSRCIP